MTEAGMQDAVAIYFNAEKNGGLLLIGIGVIVLAAAGVFLQRRYELRSFAISLAVLLASAASNAAVVLFPGTERELRWRTPCRQPR